MQSILWLPFVLTLSSLCAQELRYHGALAFYNHGSYVEITEHSGVDSYGDLVIPKSIEGLPVTHIGEAAFEDKSILSVTIPDTVVFIGDDAFYRCEELKTVQFSQNLNEIGTRAFASCSELTELTLPLSIRTIGYAAFRYCQKLKRAPLPAGLESMGDYIFADSGLEEFALPESITAVPPFAYSGTSLKTILIPDHVVEVGEGAFSSCPVSQLDLGANLERIGEAAFAACSSLTVVIIPAEVDHLGSQAFSGCERLAGVIMEGPPPSYVGSSLFSRYNGLPNLYYDSAQSEFLAYANLPWQKYDSTPIQGWQTVDGFTGVVLEEEVFLIAYSGRGPSISIPSTLFDLPVTKIGTYAFFRNTEIASVRIPRSVRLIEPYAFSECDSLSTVFVEGAAVTIDERAFYSSSNLTACVFEDDAPNLLGFNNFTERTTRLYFYEDARDFTEPRHRFYDSQSIVSSGILNGLFYVNKGDEIEITGYSGETDSLVIPEFIENLPVRSITRRAFANRIELLSVQLPPSIRDIGLEAFSNCYNLESINLPEGITLIPEEAFEHCRSLKNINYPSTLIEVGKRAFYRCLELRDLQLPEGLTTIGITAYDNCPIETIIFPSSLETVGGEAFSGCANLRWVQFLGDVTRVSGRAFNNCSNLRWVEFGGDLSELNVDAFSRCTSLSSIIYHGSQAPTPLGFNYFYNTPDGITIYHLQGVTGFDHTKYNSCRKVVFQNIGQGDGFFYVEVDSEIWVAAADDLFETVLIPDQISSHPVTRIASAAFLETDQLKHITLPDTLVEIEADAFFGSSLLTIDFGSGLEAIGNRAFSNAHSLTYVELPASIQTIGIDAFRWCFRLETVVLGAGLLSLGDYAFDFNSDLDTVIFEGNAPTLGVDALDKYANYYYRSGATGFDLEPWVSWEPQTFTVYGFLDGMHYVGDANGISIVGFSNWWTDDEVVIPSEINGTPVVTLEAGLFYYKRVNSVTVPSSVHTIGNNAFNTVYGLEKVIFDGVLPDDFSGISNAYNYSLYHINVPDDYVSPLLRPVIFTGVDPESGLVYYNTGSEIRIVDNWSTDAAIIVPSMIAGLPVTQIADRAFESDSGITTIQLPDSLERIGDYAFKSCDQLLEIIIPNTVATVGRNAFERCSSLFRVQLPIALEVIEPATFYLCTSLTDITLPDTLLSIGDSALRGCESLSSIQIPSTVTTISTGAFRDCTGLETIEIPEGIVALEAYTFQGCSKLETVGLPSTMNRLGVRSFYLCSSLRHVVVPSTVTEIDDGAFKNCHSLNTILFEGNAPVLVGADSFNEVGRYFSFYYLSGASGFSLPTWQGQPVHGVWEYGYDQGLLMVSYSKEAAVLDYSGEHDVLALPTHFDSVPIVEIAPAAFIGRQSLTLVGVPDTVSTVGPYAFAGCDQLTTITLPIGLNRIAEGTFSSCSALQSIILPESVMSIGAGAFSGCTRLSINSLHEGIESIGDYAFSSCDSIVSMQMPDSVIVCGKGVFKGSKALTDITIPAGLTVIPESMFQDCSALQNIQFPSSLQGIGDYAFANCRSLQGFNFPDSLVAIGSYAFQGCTALSSLSFPQTVTTFYDFAFDGCIGLSSIYFVGDAPQDFGDGVFPSHSEAPMVFHNSSSTGFSSTTWNGMPVGGASGLIGGLYFRIVDGGVEITGTSEELPNVNIPSNINGLPVTSIAAQTFSNHSDLLTIFLPHTIEHIGERAFNGCTRLTNIVLPDNLKTIGEYAFYDCDTLVHLRIPEGVESVGSHAFSDCLHLRSVNIGASQISFLDYTFSYCYNLVSVLFEAEGPSRWGPNSLASSHQSCRIWVLEGTELAQDYAIFQNFPTRLIAGFADGIYYRISDGTHLPEGDIEIAGFSGHTGWLVIPVEIDGKTVSGIAYRAFEECDELRYVFIPEGLLRVGSYAFVGCKKLAFIDIPDSVMEIGSYAFDGCTGLRFVLIGRGIDVIGDYAFSATTKLMEILFTGDAPENASTNFFGENRVVKHYYGATGFDASSWSRYRTRGVSHDQSSWKEFYSLTGGLDLWGAKDETGSPLIFRYAFNLDPDSAGEVYSLTPPRSGEDLEISFYSMADDILYFVETSTDLVQWGSQNVTLREDLENGRTIATIPFVEGSNFVRLRIEKNPID